MATCSCCLCVIRWLLTNRSVGRSSTMQCGAMASWNDTPLPCRVSRLPVLTAAVERVSRMPGAQVPSGWTSYIRVNRSPFYTHSYIVPGNRWYIAAGLIPSIEKACRIIHTPRRGRGRMVCSRERECFSRRSWRGMLIYISFRSGRMRVNMSLFVLFCFSAFFARSVAFYLWQFHACSSRAAATVKKPSEILPTTGSSCCTCTYSSSTRQYVPVTFLRHESYVIFCLS